jgi:RNA polymerase sigma-32 factor
MFGNHYDESTVSQLIGTAFRQPMLSGEQKNDLAGTTKSKLTYIQRNRLVTSHMRIVPKIAIEFKGYGPSMEDMIQEGNVGLIEAAKRFEPAKGYQFVTFATTSVRSCLRSYVMENFWQTKGITTATRKALFFNKNLILAKLDGQANMSPEVAAVVAKEINEKIEAGRKKRKKNSRKKPIADGEFLAKPLDGGSEEQSSESQPPETPHKGKRRYRPLVITANDVLWMVKRLADGEYSLSTPVGEYGSLSFQDTLGDDATNQEMIVAERDELNMRRSWLNDALKTLNEREKKIFVTRRLDEVPQISKALADHYVISRTRIGQI